MFFVRGRKRDGYSVILTTDTSLDFRKVIEIYGYRWSIEVAIRDLKQHLCLTKCQARNFTGHISHTSICIIRYNLLSMAMRRGHYKTIGGLFRDIQDDCMELTVIEKFRILFWEMIDHLQNYIESADVIEDFLLSLTTINSKFKLITDYKYRYRESS